MKTLTLHEVFEVIRDTDFKNIDPELVNKWESLAIAVMKRTGDAIEAAEVVRYMIRLENPLRRFERTAA